MDCNQHLFFGFLHHCVGGQKKPQRADSHVVKTEKSCQKILMAIAIIVQEPLGQFNKGSTKFSLATMP